MMELIWESLDCKNVNIPFSVHEEQKFGYLNEYAMCTGTCYLICAYERILPERHCTSKSYNNAWHQEDRFSAKKQKDFTIRVY